MNVRLATLTKAIQVTCCPYRSFQGHEAKSVERLGMKRARGLNGVRYHTWQGRGKPFYGKHSEESWISSSYTKSQKWFRLSNRSKRAIGKNLFWRRRLVWRSRGKSRRRKSSGKWPNQYTAARIFSYTKNDSCIERSDCNAASQLENQSGSELWVSYGWKKWLVLRRWSFLR